NEQSFCTARLNTNRLGWVPKLWLFDNHQLLIRGDWSLQHLPGAAGPEDGDFVDGLGAPQTEVQGERALRQITRLPVVDLGERPAAGSDFDLRPQSVPVRAGSRQPDLDKSQVRMTFAEVAEQHQGGTVEIVGDDVQVSVLVEIEEHRRARTEG